MNRTSFPCFAFELFVLSATATEAAPIRYSADWVTGTFAFGDPAGLAGAHVRIEAILDPASLSATLGPDYTSWRSSSGGFASVVQMTISGSAHADGTSSGFSVGWDFYNDSGYSSGALQVDPPADLVLEGPFEVWPGGYDMTIGQLVLALPASFNSPASDGTIFPYPFENSDLIVAGLHEVCNGSRRRRVVRLRVQRFCSCREPSRARCLDVGTIGDVSA